MTWATPGIGGLGAWVRWVGGVKARWSQILVTAIYLARDSARDVYALGGDGYLQTKYAPRTSV
jgi:hypothetical protein